MTWSKTMDRSRLIIDLTQGSDDETNNTAHNGQVNTESLASSLALRPNLPRSSLKRKSAEYELDQSNNASFSSHNGGLSFKHKTPLKLEPSKASAIQSFEVLIPSPTAQQQEALRKAKTEEPFLGLSQTVYPVDEEEQTQAALNAYPTSRTVDRSVIPFQLFFDPINPSNGHPPNSSDSTLIRRFFEQKLSTLEGPKVTFAVDDEKLAFLSSTFGFINDYILVNPVVPQSEEFETGCNCEGPCRPDNCSCLDEEDESDYESDNEGNDEDARPRINPYDESRRAGDIMVLSRDFLKKKQRNSECNPRCSCKGRCWNNIVQRGRQIRLEVFYTGNRGFGLRSPDNVITGQFIDRYLGEVITKYDADLREEAADKNTSYLFSLDFFASSEDDDKPDVMDDGILQSSSLNNGLRYGIPYVVDGQKFGSPTRFMNHSCNPNCKIVPVSTTSHYDEHLYHLAFFALKDIPAGTELTFDYNPMWSGEAADKDDPNIVKCHCGEKNCRGQLWPNARQKSHQRNEA